MQQIAEDAVAFFDAFQIGEEDLQVLLRYYHAGHSLDAAACIWINENAAKWTPWITFPSRKKVAMSLCGPVDCETTGVFFFWFQLITGCVLIWSSSRSQVSIRFKHLEGSHHLGSKKMVSRMHEIISSLSKEKTNQLHQLRTPLDRSKMSPMMKVADAIDGSRDTFIKKLEFETAMYDVPTCACHLRSYENFVRTNMDPNIVFPPRGPADSWLCGVARKDLWLFVFFSKTWTPVIAERSNLARYG